ncbi:hypothetical protein [Streptomyces sp. 6-11-2]|uniref:hypothetical protein n=1 Tax=Streptomyces sp. 6-11-2 TaxID=2585753 RepID=UPI00114163F7|nr:hypothetical protein [Streptomyces sp. 6-11-2]GED89932.1 hypothetical protein TNCT6_70170 [Streptomyces sp. 6-11-2]
MSNSRSGMRAKVWGVYAEGLITWFPNRFGPPPLQQRWNRRLDVLGGDPLGDPHRPTEARIELVTCNAPQQFPVVRKALGYAQVGRTGFNRAAGPAVRGCENGRASHSAYGGGRAGRGCAYAYDKWEALSS